MNINLKDIDDPNIVGEILRDKCFIKHNSEDLGAYSTFDLADGFQQIDDVDPLKREIVNVIHSDNFPVGADSVYIDPDFESEDDERSLDERRIDDEFNLKNTPVYSNGEIICGYHWESDGTLVFKFDDTIVINTDCKKDHTWKFAKIIKNT